MRIETWGNHKIRFVERGGEWWAVAKDVADALDYSQTQAMTKLIKSENLIHSKLDDMNMVHVLVNEKGIYQAIFGSHKPDAVEFQDWVFDTIKKLRQSLGFESYEVFRMLDKEHQKAAMKFLDDNISNISEQDYIKANSISNKAISNIYGLPKMISKAEMSPQMLQDREPILNDVVNLMVANNRFGLGLSISKTVYEKYCRPARSA